MNELSGLPHCTPPFAMRQVLATKDPAKRANLIAACVCMYGTPGVHDMPYIEEAAFCPTYPGLRGKPSAQLALGLAKPVDLCPGMTSKEAHDFLSQSGANALPPVEWFIARTLHWDEKFKCEHGTAGRFGNGIAVGQPDLSLICTIHPRDIPTARWFVAVLRDPDRLSALLREREGRGPHGERYTYRLVERADEIDHRDLAEGESTGVVTAFERAAERMIEDHVKEHGDEPLAEPPEWWTPLPGARLLLTARELAIEGREMQHCVSGYAPYVKAGRSVIVALNIALNIAGERSTVEFDRSGRVRQHRGVRNASPSKTSRDVLGMMRSAWGLVEEPAAERVGRAFMQPFQNLVQGFAALRDEFGPLQVHGGCREPARREDVERALEAIQLGTPSEDATPILPSQLSGHRQPQREVHIEYDFTGSHNGVIGHAPRDIAAGELMRVTLPPVEPITYTDTPSTTPNPFLAAYQRGIANTEDA